MIAGCREAVNCTEDETGTISAEVVAVSIPENAHCDTNDVKCDAGFQWSADRSKCIKKPNECPEGFKSEGKQCTLASPEKVAWPQAVDFCNRKNSDLINIDGPEDEAKVKNFLTELGLECVIISGSVKLESSDETSGSRNNADVNSKSKDIKSNGKKVAGCLSKTEDQESVWRNHKCSGYVKDKVQVDTRLVDGDVKDNKTHHLAAFLINGTLKISPILHKTECSVFCVQRNTTDAEDLAPCRGTEFFGKDGRPHVYLGETTSSECTKCGRVLGVKCVPADSSAASAELEPWSCSKDSFGAKRECLSGNCAEVNVTVRCERDADECKTGRHNCPTDSLCVNTHGSYLCVCSKIRPLYINGQCTEALTCSMHGTQEKDGYSYDLTNFGATTGFFPYDCTFKLVAPCPGSVAYLTSAYIPLLYLYVLKSSADGENIVTLSGYVVQPGNTKISFRISQKGLSNGIIWAGKNGAALAETTVGSQIPDAEILTRSVQANTVSIHNKHNYFSVEVTFVGNKFIVKVIVSAQYKNTYCGACSKSPNGTPSLYDLTDVEKDEISVQDNA
ncbi:unnamed protein product, partial [Candidula unifasciata]